MRRPQDVSDEDISKNVLVAVLPKDTACEGARSL